MNYPKPLSEKSLKRLYSESGLSDKQIDFLHRLFENAANLYGIISVRDMWNVYNELSEKIQVPKLHRKDIVTFSSIARREVQPYYVAEIDDLYSMEKRSELAREIVLQSLICPGYAGLSEYYELSETQCGKPYFVPENLLNFVERPESTEELKLRVCLEKLKVTMKTTTDEHGNTVKCQHFGKKLKDFSYYNSHEDFMIKYEEGEIDGKKPNEKRAEYFKNEYRGPESDKLLRNIKHESSMGFNNPTSVIKDIFDELNELGVSMDEDQANRLINLIYTFHNSSNLMCNRGWAPEELMRKSAAENPNMQPMMTLGPGIRKAIEDGKIDIDELRAMMEAKGIKVDW